MVTGSLQIKKDMYYVVLSIKGADGKRKQKWVATHISATGNNKREANRFRDELIATYEEEEYVEPSEPSYETKFIPFVRQWVETIKFVCDPITFEGYKCAVDCHIIPYFNSIDPALEDVTPMMVQRFTTHLLKEGNLKTGGPLSNKSVRNYLTVLSQIFNDAIEKGVIQENPVKKVKKPKKTRYSASFYSSQQIKEMTEALKDESLLPLIMITAMYGLRRSEVLGLKWDSLDFDNKRVTIKHVVCRHNTIVEKDTTKTKSSYRTYPMTPVAEKIFREAKQREKENEQLFGDAYRKNDYVFKWDDGKPYPPDYVTNKFRKLLAKYNLPQIRFHDLRHSCASILIELGYNLKDIQEWLGHSDIETTGNVYGHLTREHLNEIGDEICGEIFS